MLEYLYQWKLQLVDGLGIRGKVVLLIGNETLQYQKEYLSTPPGLKFISLGHFHPNFVILCSNGAQLRLIETSDLIPLLNPLPYSYFDAEYGLAQGSVSTLYRGCPLRI